jgi:hypothetical protein
MNDCVQGFTNQEDCDDCGYCYTYGYNDCVKGYNSQEDCDMCGVCRFH